MKGGEYITMRRIILSLVTILATAGMVAGATRAVFSTSTPLTGNTISTATLNLTLENLMNKPLNVTNMVPGEVTDWAWVDVRNASTIPVNFFVYLDNATGIPDWNLWTNLRIEMRRAGAVVEGAEAGRCIAGDSSQIYLGLVSGMYQAALKQSIANNVAVQGVERVCQRVSLDNNVDNSVQGRSTGFNEVFYAEQSVL